MGSNAREYRRLCSKDCNDKLLCYRYETRYPIHNEPVCGKEYKSVEKTSYSIKKLIEIYCEDRRTRINHWKIGIYIEGPRSLYI